MIKNYYIYLALTITLGYCDLNNEAHTFKNLEAQKFSQCVVENGVNFEKRCYFSKKIIQHQEPYDGTFVTPIKFINKYYNNDRDIHILLMRLIELGANPKDVSRAIIDSGSLESYEMLLNIADGPNGLRIPGGANDSIMHRTISSWQVEKVETMLRQEIDLEQKNNMGKTAILIAGSSIGSGLSEFHKIDRLLDAGADPTILDNKGRGLCYLINYKPSNWDDEFPNQRQELADRLLKGYNMDCEYKGYRGK